MKYFVRLALFLLIFGLLAGLFFSVGRAQTVIEPDPIAPGHVPGQPDVYPPQPGAAPAALAFLPEEINEPSEAVGEDLMESQWVPIGLPWMDYANVLYEVYSFRTSSWNLHWKQFSTGNVVQLTNTEFSDIQPRLNPKGTEYVFVSNRTGNYEIFRAPLGGTPVLLTVTSSDEFWPVWSPDGSQIAFTSERNRNGDIYVMNQDGSNVRRLTDAPNYDFSPVWSSDGQQIAWIRTMSSSHGQIWMMDVDGSNQHPVSGLLAYIQNLTWYDRNDQFGFSYDANGDYYFDLGAYRISSQQTREIMLGDLELKTEYINRSYWLYHHATRFQYAQINGQWYIYDMDLIFVGDDRRDYVLISSEDYCNRPDVSSLDRTPPVAWILPLPEYTRFNASYVHWRSLDQTNEWDAVQSGSYQAAVQYYTDAWRDLVYPAYPSGTTDNPILYTDAAPGDTAGFRAQSIDRAGNYSALSPEVFTTFYRWILTGQLTDNRGYPVVGAAVTVDPQPINPVTVDRHGSFHAYLKNRFSQTFIFHSASGYGLYDFGDIEYIGDSRRVSYYYPPLDDLFYNGDFDEFDLLDGWDYSGSLPYRILDEGYTNSGIALGVPVDLDQIIVQEVAYSGYSTVLADIQRDALGQIHLVWRGSDGNAHYGLRDLSGSWQPAINLGAASHISIDMDDTGRLYVSTTNSTGVHYFSRSAEGLWSGPETVVNSGNTSTVRVGGDGQIYVAVASDSALAAYRKTASSWAPVSAEIPITRATLPGLAVSASGDVYLGTCISRNAVAYHIQPGSEPKKLPPPGFISGCFYIGMAVDAHERAVIINHSYELELAKLNPDGTWTAPIPIGTRNGSMTWAQSPTKHFYFLVTNSNDIKAGTSRVYFPSLESVPVEHKVYPPITNLSSPTFDVDADGQIHMAMAGSQRLWYKQIIPSVVTETQYAELSHPYSLDLNLHKPTLAFAYQLRSDANWQDSGLSLWLTDSQTRHLLWSTQDATSDWTLAWFDLQDWAGETITLTWRLDQIANEPCVELRLDSISLGSWMTPLIETVDLIQPEPQVQRDALSISIRGQNFISTPQVRLGDRWIEAVTWLDETHLQLTLPADFQPGFYDVWVVNPGGQQAVWHNNLQIGERILLPNLVK